MTALEMLREVKTWVNSKPTYNFPMPADFERSLSEDAKKMSED